MPPKKPSPPKIVPDLTPVTKAKRKAKVANLLETGVLPHQWLLKIAQGEPIPHRQWKINYDAKGNEKSRELIEVEVYPDFLTRIDCAKASAQFYAPKLAAQTVQATDKNSALAKIFDQLADVLPK